MRVSSTIFSGRRSSSRRSTAPCFACLPSAALRQDLESDTCLSTIGEFLVQGGFRCRHKQRTKLHLSRCRRYATRAVLQEEAGPWRLSLQHLQ